MLSEKIDVKGSNQHSIYKWLTDEKLNGSKSSNVKWNFQKYLVNKEGQLVDVFYSSTKPTSDKITSLLD
jgi:glutathione peroxidase